MADIVPLQPLLRGILPPFLEIDQTIQVSALTDDYKIFVAFGNNNMTQMQSQINNVDHMMSTWTRQWVISLKWIKRVYFLEVIAPFALP